MATVLAWADGYLEQARADLAGVLLVQGGEPSVIAMLLQMILEKLGKAALLKSGHININAARGSHLAATRMVRVLSRDRRACARLGWQPNLVRGSVLPVVDELERAQPQVAGGGPCLEYPWEDPAGVVRWPAKDLPLIGRFRARQQAGVRVLRFAKDLCSRFHQVFA